MQIRNLLESDLDDIFELELDVSPWAIGEEELARLRSGTSTWGRVVEDGAYFMGAFLFDVLDDGYTVIWSTFYPENADDVVEAMATYLKRKANATQRKKVRVYLRDSDEAGLRKIVPAWHSQGFKSRLLRRHFGDMDGWEMYWEAK